MSKTGGIIFMIIATVAVTVFLYFAANPSKSEIRDPGVIVVESNVLDSGVVSQTQQRPDVTSNAIPIVISSADRGREDPFSEP